MSLEIIIPTYNRLPNLLLAMEALGQQTTDDFRVLVADDGSTDGTRDAVAHLASTKHWRGRLRRIDCGPRQGWRPARTRNLAVASLPEDCSFFVMLDSDALLEKHAVERFSDVSRRYPGAVILGITDWLPPLSLDEVRRVLRSGCLRRLREYVMPAPARRLEGTHVGSDVRIRAQPEVFRSVTEVRCRIQPRWALSSNTGYPVALFHRLGRFDEAIAGYGYEDYELGVRAYKAEVECVVCPAIWSLHVWHRKEQWELRRLEEQHNIDYVFRKHGWVESLAVYLNWTYWRHYHRERGGRIVSTDGTLWAINTTATHRLELGDPQWIQRLGYPPTEVIPWTDTELTSLANMGVAKLNDFDERVRLRLPG